MKTLKNFDKNSIEKLFSYFGKIIAKNKALENSIKLRQHFLHFCREERFRVHPSTCLCDAPDRRKLLILFDTPMLKALFPGT